MGRNLFERKMGKQGRIVIPSDFRKWLDIGEGDSIALYVEDERIIIEKANKESAPAVKAERKRAAATERGAIRVVRRRIKRG